jgi:hypothetical protein
VPALRANKAAQAKLDGMIAGCFVIQKLYGRQPENIEIINRTFHSVLGKFPADKVVRAFEVWLERSQEFPTPADIIGLVKRNGKPSLSKELYIAISRKDGAERSPDDWRYLRDYEADQRGEAMSDDQVDERKAEAVQEENRRLRARVRELEAENRRAWDIAEAKPAPIERARPNLAVKIAATIAAMKADGAPEADIEAFKSQMDSSAPPNANGIALSPSTP